MMAPSRSRSAPTRCTAPRYPENLTGWVIRRPVQAQRCRWHLLDVLAGQSHCGTVPRRCRAQAAQPGVASPGAVQRAPIGLSRADFQLPGRQGQADTKGLERRLLAYPELHERGRIAGLFALMQRESTQRVVRLRRPLKRLDVDAHRRMRCQGDGTQPDARAAAAAQRRRAGGCTCGARRQSSAQRGLCVTRRVACTLARRTAFQLARRLRALVRQRTPNDDHTSFAQRLVDGPDAGLAGSGRGHAR
jgi:hypothetical protein